MAHHMIYAILLFSAYTNIIEKQLLPHTVHRIPYTFNYKPDPDSIQYILNQYDVNAKHAVIIGDSVNDILAGKNAGVITCAVTYGYSIKSALYSLDPDIVIEKPIELCKIFIPNKQVINKID